MLAARAPAGVLDLADTTAAALLRERLAQYDRDADPAADVVLTSDEERAYQETVARINQMWSQGDPLNR